MATSIAPRNGQPKKPIKLSLVARAKRTAKQALAAVRRPAPAATTYPPSPYLNWGYEEAASAIDDALANQTIDTSSQAGQAGDAGTAITPAPGEVFYQNPRLRQNPIAVNRAFFQGDHWQRGSGYIGPHPAANEPGFNDTMNEIGLIFTSQNVVKEVDMRHTLGVAGKPIRWSWVPRRATGDEKPTADEQKAIDEVTALCRTWMEARKIQTLMRDVVSTLLFAERAAIKLAVPAGLTTTSDEGVTMVSAASIEQGLAKIWPEHPQPEHAVVVTDTDTKLEAGIQVYEGERAADASGASDAGAGETDVDDEAEDAAADYAWLCFLNDVGQTVFRIVSDSDGGDDADDAPKESTLDLGGRITMFELHRPALITPQVQQAQRALNFALTMVPRNVTTGGFLERLILDAQLPGHHEVDANGVKTGKWIQNPFYVGAGTTNFIQGAEYTVTNEQGEVIVKRGSPSVQFRDPVKPDASLTAKDAHYRSILEETGQLHVLISGDATASAVARIQARAEYLNTLLLTQPDVEAAMRWLLETAVAMAEAIAQTPGKYTRLLRAQVQCKLDAGPITPEERKAIEASIGVTISKATAMLMLNVDDVDAETSRMAADPASRAALAEKIGKALQLLTMAGATLEGAAKFLKLEQKEIDDLLTPETFEATPAGVRLNQPKPGEPGAAPPPAPLPIPSVPGTKAGTAPPAVPHPPAGPGASAASSAASNAGRQTKPTSSGSTPGGQ